MSGHLATVGQGFLDGELWSAECTCGWFRTHMLPYEEAVAAAQEHARQAESERPGSAS